MEIQFKKGSCFELIVEADNVKIVEDVTCRKSSKSETGKLLIEKDVETSALEQIVEILDDMIYYREEEFDSSFLIKNLFEKLPQNSASELLVYLNETYEICQLKN